MRTMTDAEGRRLMEVLAEFDRIHAACIEAGSCEAAGDLCPGITAGP
jgi:hypothetical protein